MGLFTPLTPEIQLATEKAMAHFKSQKSFCARAGVSKNAIVSIRDGRRKYLREETVRRVLQFQKRINPDELEWITRKELQDRKLERKTGGLYAKFKSINGVVHKMCNGRSHSSPTWIAVDSFRPQTRGKKGKYRSQCNDCDAFYHGSESMVKFSQYEWMVVELVNRLGVEEAARRIGISQQTMYHWRNRKPLKIKRKNARKVVNTLATVRKAGEVRHRDSIRHGSLVRNHKEKIPVDQRDFYKPHGDYDNEVKRKHLAAITA